MAKKLGRYKKEKEEIWAGAGTTEAGRAGAERHGGKARAETKLELRNINSV